MKTIRFVILVVISLVVLAIPASAQEKSWDDPVWKIDFGMRTSTAYDVHNQTVSPEESFKWLTGKYNIGLVYDRPGKGTDAIKRFRENVPKSPLAVVDPTLVRMFWGWEYEKYVVLTKNGNFDWGPVGSIGVAWFEGHDTMYPWAAGLRLRYGIVYADGMYTSVGKGISAGFGLQTGF